MVSKPRLVVVNGFLLSLLLIAYPVYAEVTTSITSTTGAGNLGTSVTQAGNVYNITGGTRPGNGTNLFHSFGNFSVGTGDIGNFLNTPVNGVLLPTSNILGRVTSGNISNIFGTIQTTNFGNANLFLMNPAGFLFGPNATVNVGGMVSFTSADYLKLTDNARFNAIPEAAADILLSASPVASFGFLGSNPRAITVQGGHFSASEGQGISLVGGDIEVTAGTLDDSTTVQPARLAAPRGQINLASVTSPGEVLASTFQPAAGMTGGAIILGPGTLLDSSGNAGGTVRIRGGSLVMDNATISANTIEGNATPISVDINLTGDLTITDTRATSAITARTNGAGNAGEVQITSANMQATSTDPGFVTFALIDGHTAGDGSAANVNITTGNLTVTGPTGTWHFIDIGPQAAGPGGNITIEAQNNIELTGTTISTGTQFAEILGVEASGPAGSLTITADRLVTDHAFLLTTATFGAETQQAGNVTMNARDISMANSTVSAAGFFGGGTITINSDSLITEATQLDTFTALGPAEGITFNGRILELRNGSTWSTSTFGDSNAGEIRVVASDHVTLLGNEGANPSGLFSNSFGEFGSFGGSGSITVTTPKLTMNGGRINSSTATSGSGGDITINSGTVELSGEFPYPDFGGYFGITDIHPSGIFTQTVGSEFCAGSCGDAGNIVANIGTLIMGPGAQLNSGTTNTGHGGTITINATNSISMSGTLSNGDPVGIFSLAIGSKPDAGAGGDITLTAGQSFTISDGASVSASSTGPGKTGNIQIAAGNQFAMTDSSVTTQADAASGGTIKISTTPSGTVQLINSMISASVLDGTGGGGSVNIDPQFVILQNSHILATATHGPGGNISITTNLLLPDAYSTISASSQFGVNGTVTIQSPNAPASGKIQPLGKTPLLATSLLNQRCAALAGGEFSSFTVAGRDSLPTEPSSWLASPLYAAGVGEGLGVRREGLEGDAPILSLRQIAPPGFLTQAFALDWSAGCTS